MRLAVTSLVALTLLASACGGSGGHVFASDGVRVVAPDGWTRVPAPPTSVSDPRTLLVVGTRGVRLKSSCCAITTFRIPADGAAVVVFGWSSVAAAGASPQPGRAPLEKLVAVSRARLECFSGRGAAADLLLGGRRYQVRVLVGDRAGRHRVAQALAVAGSFDRGR